MKYSKEQIEFLKEHNLSGFREYRKDVHQEKLQNYIDEHNDKIEKFQIIESKMNTIEL